jgi:N-acetylglucosamine kinase-like BadF-type ATPase
MILIADSGSTKTDWSLLNSKETKALRQTPGINPYQQNQKEIQDVLKETLHFEEKDTIEYVYFYGTGCALAPNQQLVKKALQTVFKKANIEVSHDLLGTVRSMCGHEAGVAAILGTGSNACQYDGKDIISPARSLGYILGDEGSGAYFGKKMVIDFLQEEMPQDLQVLFYERFHQDRAAVLENVYQKPYPNRYLASFSPFLIEQINHSYIIETLKEGFSLFFDKYILALPDFQNDLPLFFTGSIAWYYKNILQEVATQKRLTIKGIVKNPMDGLIKYHQTLLTQNHA